MKSAIAFFRSGMSGGSATLSYRIGKKFKELGFNVYYFYEEINDRNNLNLFVNSGFVLKKQKRITKALLPEDRIIIITYSLEEHVKASHVFKRNKNATVYLYPISNGITGSGSRKFNNICILGKRIVRSYFQSVYYSNLILFAGQKTAKAYSSYYDLTLSNNEWFPLPINTTTFDEQIVTKRYSSSPRRIISFLRADFPLKGYVFPLIKAFYILQKEFANISLLLIVSQDTGDLVKKEIEKYSFYSKPVVVPGCSYEDLIHLINCSYINVGHGTSVLDAAALSLPSIVSVELSFDDECCGFYGDTIINPTGTIDLAISDYYSVLKSAFSMNLEDYLTCSFKTNQTVYKNNSLDSFANKLIERNETIHSLQIKRKKLYLMKVKFDEWVYKIVSFFNHKK